MPTDIERTHDAAILDGLAQPRTLPLTRETWLAAAIIGGLRVAVNNATRSKRRDRGAEKNLLGDSWGAIGELIALAAVNEIASLPVSHHPIDFQGSVDEVDLTVREDAGSIRLEAKAHLLEPPKRWFLVNRGAHERAIERGAVAYIPVLSALGAGVALVGRAIPVGEVGTWREPPMPLEDPAVGIRLEDLAERHLAGDLSWASEAIRADVVISRRELTETAQGAIRDRRRWRELLPALGDRSAHEVVATVLEVGRTLGGNQLWHGDSWTRAA